MVGIRACFCDRLREFALPFMRQIIAGIIVGIIVAVVAAIVVPIILLRNDNLPRIMITAAQFDAPGNDWKNLNGEWVAIGNFEKRDEVDMTRWVLHDDEKHEYLFPEGFTLAAEGNVTVYTGSGNDTQTELYMGWKTPIWDNAGDNATLKDSNGQAIDRWPPS